MGMHGSDARDKSNAQHLARPATSQLSLLDALLTHTYCVWLTQSKKNTSFYGHDKYTLSMQIKLRCTLAFIYFPTLHRQTA